MMWSGCCENLCSMNWQVLKLMWAQPEISLPDEVVENASRASFSGVDHMRQVNQMAYKKGDSQMGASMAMSRRGPSGFLFEIQSHVRPSLAFVFPVIISRGPRSMQPAVRCALVCP